MDDEGHQIGYKVLPRGTPVVSADGVQVGTVQQVLDNQREHIFDGIVMKTRDGLRFVDAPEVARIAERRVTLTIDAEEANRLPEHAGALGRAGRAGRRIARRMRPR
jgi:hypothetical protein